MRDKVIQFCVSVLSMSVATAGAAQEAEPSRYPGNVDGIKFLIPSAALLLPVRYEGEDDWHPPLKPRNERTFADRLSMAELGHFDIAGLDFDPDPDGTKPMEEPPWGEIGVTIRFFDRGWSPPANGKSWFPDLLKNPHNGAVQWDLNTRYSDRLSPDYNHGFDRDYTSRNGLVWIICDNSRMSVEPFSKVPDHCFLRAIDLDDHAEVQARFPSRFMRSWQEIYRRAYAVVASWRYSSGSLSWARLERRKNT